MMYEYVELMLCGNMFSIVQLKECEYERHVARNSVTIQQKLHRGLVISGIRRNQQPNDTAFVVESFPYDSPDERGIYFSGEFASRFRRHDPVLNTKLCCVFTRKSDQQIL
jgi:hypothetical protein